MILFTAKAHPSWKKFRTFRLEKNSSILVQQKITYLYHFLNWKFKNITKTTYLLFVKNNNNNKTHIYYLYKFISFYHHILTHYSIRIILFEKGWKLRHGQNVVVKFELKKTNIMNQMWVTMYSPVTTLYNPWIFNGAETFSISHEGHF